MTLCLFVPCALVLVRRAPDEPAQRMPNDEPVQRTQITVPVGATPGMTLRVRLVDGRVLRVAVPSGAVPGAILTVDMVGDEVLLATAQNPDEVDMDQLTKRERIERVRLAQLRLKAEREMKNNLLVGRGGSPPDEAANNGHSRPPPGAPSLGGSDAVSKPPTGGLLIDSACGGGGGNVFDVLCGGGEADVDFDDQPGCFDSSSLGPWEKGSTSSTSQPPGVRVVDLSLGTDGRGDAK